MCSIASRNRRKARRVLAKNAKNRPMQKHGRLHHWLGVDLGAQVRSARHRRHSIVSRRKDAVHLQTKRRGVDFLLIQKP